MNKRLQVLDADLPRVLGEVLQPEKNKHDLYVPDILWGGRHGYQIYECQKCGLKKGLSLEEKEQWLVDSPCPVPDLIPIDDWNVAMKWRDWAVAEYGEGVFVNEMSAIYWDIEYIGDDISVTGEGWAIGRARPKHYLLAAADLKLSKENNND